MNRALKVRNMIASYSALSELHAHFALSPGATRFALAPGFHIPRLRRSNEIYSAFGAQMKSVATVSPVVVAAF
jgi:hypothetical protein